MSFASHILVPTDFSDASKLAAQGARLLAERFGARVTLLHVHDPEALRAPIRVSYGPERLEALEAQIRGEIEAHLQTCRDTALADLEHVDRIILEAASPAEAICAWARNHGVDLIVTSTHGRTGLRHLLIGSVAERIVRLASCPVLSLRSLQRD